MSRKGAYTGRPVAVTGRLRGVFVLPVWDIREKTQAWFYTYAELFPPA